MIKSFAHKGLERFFTKGDKSGINAQSSERITRILDRLDAATEANDMNLQDITFMRSLAIRQGFIVYV